MSNRFHLSISASNSAGSAKRSPKAASRRRRIWTKGASEVVSSVWSGGSPTPNRLSTAPAAALSAKSARRSGPAAAAGPNAYLDRNASSWPGWGLDGSELTLGQHNASLGDPATARCGDGAVTSVGGVYGAAAGALCGRPSAGGATGWGATQLEVWHRCGNGTGNGPCPAPAPTPSPTLTCSLPTGYAANGYTMPGAPTRNVVAGGLGLPSLGLPDLGLAAAGPAVSTAAGLGPMLCATGFRGVPQATCAPHSTAVQRSWLIESPAKSSVRCSMRATLASSAPSAQPGALKLERRWSAGWVEAPS